MAQRTTIILLTSKNIYSFGTNLGQSTVVPEFLSHLRVFFFPSSIFSRGGGRGRNSLLLSRSLTRRLNQTSPTMQVMYVTSDRSVTSFVVNLVNLRHDTLIGARPLIKLI